MEKDEEMIGMVISIKEDSNFIFCNAKVGRSINTNEKSGRRI
jgi:hypothetical protein